MATRLISAQQIEINRSDYKELDRSLPLNMIENLYHSASNIIKRYDTKTGEIVFNEGGKSGGPPAYRILFLGIFIETHDAIIREISGKLEDKMGKYVERYTSMLNDHALEVERASNRDEFRDKSNAFYNKSNALLIEMQQRA